MIFTCLTLSKDSFNRNILPDNTGYLNYNSFFNDELGLKISFKKALEQINTPYFFSCDSDDLVPDKLFIPSKGMCYGDNYHKHLNKLHIIKNGEWNIDKHLNFPYFIHKAIYNTKAVKHVIEYIPDIELNFYFILHFLLAATYGGEYNKDLKIIWYKNETGMHSKAFLAKKFSMEWLKLNYKNLINDINFTKEI